jgi:hypothetical protein
MLKKLFLPILPTSLAPDRGPTSGTQTIRTHHFIVCALPSCAAHAAAAAKHTGACYLARLVEELNGLLGPLGFMLQNTPEGLQSSPKGKAYIGVFAYYVQLWQVSDGLLLLTLLPVCN